MRSSSAKMFLIIATVVVIGGIAGLAYWLVSSRPESICDQVKNGESVELAASDVSYCAGKECEYDVTKCGFPCPLGYHAKSGICPSSCYCSTRGLYGGDMEFEEDMIPELLKKFGVLEQDAAGIGLFSSVAEKRRMNWYDKRQPNDRYRIPYLFHDNLDITMKQKTEKAFAKFSNLTCIDFVPWNFEDSKVIFRDGELCSSAVGKYKRGQDVKLNRLCRSSGTVEHQLMHVLGFSHEHTHPDRDDYITIIPENIEPGMMMNFMKYSESFIRELGTTYDIGSLLHFHSYAYSIDVRNPTILDKATGQPITPLVHEMSVADLTGINEFYRCPGGGAPKSTKDLEKSGFYGKVEEIVTNEITTTTFSGPTSSPGGFDGNKSSTVADPDSTSTDSTSENIITTGVTTPSQKSTAAETTKGSIQVDSTTQKVTIAETTKGSSQVDSTTQKVTIAETTKGSSQVNSTTQKVTIAETTKGSSQVDSTTGIPSSSATTIDPNKTSKPEPTTIAVIPVTKPKATIAPSVLPVGGCDKPALPRSNWRGNQPLPQPKNIAVKSNETDSSNSSSANRGNEPDKSNTSISDAAGRTNTEKNLNRLLESESNNREATNSNGFVPSGLEDQSDSTTKHKWTAGGDLITITRISPTKTRVEVRSFDKVVDYAGPSNPADCVPQPDNKPNETSVVEVTTVEPTSPPKKTWSIWGSWTQCMKTCGKGEVRNRYRACEKEKEHCIGRYYQKTICPALMDCPNVWTEWGPWGEYGSCSKTCNRGLKLRSRKCPSGATCSPVNVHTQTTARYCNTEACSAENQPYWTQWGEFSVCSKSCDGGRRLRNRTCLLEQRKGYTVFSLDCLGPWAENNGCNYQACQSIEQNQNTTKTTNGTNETTVKTNGTKEETGGTNGTVGTNGTDGTIGTNGTGGTDGTIGTNGTGGTNETVGTGGTNGNVGTGGTNGTDKTGGSDENKEGIDGIKKEIEGTKEEKKMTTNKRIFSRIKKKLPRTCVGGLGIPIQYLFGHFNIDTKLDIICGLLDSEVDWRMFSAPMEGPVKPGILPKYRSFFMTLRDCGAAQRWVGDFNGDQADDIMCHDHQLARRVVRFTAPEAPQLNFFKKKQEVSIFCDGSHHKQSVFDPNGDYIADLFCRYPNERNYELVHNVLTRSDPGGSIFG